MVASTIERSGASEVAAMTRLSPQEQEAALAGLPGWQRSDQMDAIVKEYHFRTFRAAMRFVNDVAAIAAELRHHPDILIRYNRVSLMLTTHDEGGVTERDVAFARRVEAERGAG
jgi:4a-hydroxytetrahydrobiopterin dehydratase